MLAELESLLKLGRSLLSSVEAYGTLKKEERLRLQMFCSSVSSALDVGYHNLIGAQVKQIHVPGQVRAEADTLEQLSKQYPDFFSMKEVELLRKAAISIEALERNAIPSQTNRDELISVVNEARGTFQALVNRVAVL